MPDTDLRHIPAETWLGIIQRALADGDVRAAAEALRFLALKDPKVAQRVLHAVELATELMGGLTPDQYAGGSRG